MRRKLISHDWLLKLLGQLLTKDEQKTQYEGDQGNGKHAKTKCALGVNLRLEKSNVAYQNLPEWNFVLRWFVVVPNFSLRSMMEVSKNCERSLFWH